MSFLGGWSTGSVAPAPTSGGGGGWSTAPSGGSTGSGWLGGSTSGSGWLSTTPTTTTGGWLASPAPAPAPTYYGGYSYQVSSPYNYQLSSGNYYPGAGLQFGPYGEGGPYTPLDFPIMRELLPGERLEDLQAQSGFARKSIVPYLVLGVIAALLLKK